ncbi:hypothetical protein CK503_03105 [Aliifodinibius salipaludis]|uniref:Uncharacterized protein n=1 Tax=Fodinibius salipaludis TaxID=2032627 RepID=A0A2A2GEL6_9BACT|nr:hypothetical protein [Aliifodinibius salipaludis]PAU95202.1 hypothetical protein CK503_03105 [Aliifodinibius salipaludis]
MSKQENKDVDALALKRKLSKKFSKKYFDVDGSFDYEKFKKAEDEIKQNLQESSNSDSTE